MGADCLAGWRESTLPKLGHCVSFTRTGTKLLPVVVPLPSAAYWAFPQQYADPVFVRPQVNAHPVVIAVNLGAF